MSDYEFWELFEDPDKPEPGSIIWVDPPPLTPEQQAEVNAAIENQRLALERLAQEKAELEARRTISYTVVYSVAPGHMGGRWEGPYKQEVLAADDEDLKVILKSSDWHWTSIESAYRTDAKVI